MTKTDAQTSKRKQKAENKNFIQTTKWKQKINIISLEIG